MEERGTLWSVHLSATEDMSELSVIAQLLLALNLVEFTGPDKQMVEVNPDEIVSIREPRGEVQAHFHKDVKCLIFMSDGKFIGVIENCHVVVEKLGIGAP